MTATQYGIAHLALFFVAGLNALRVLSLAYQSKALWRFAFASLGLLALLQAGYSGFRAVQSLMT